uniref:Uncharacterized protein n=1 Tax=Steinernema glaseri TaxID=37863 RepID=A0A1I7YC81_9BILA
MQCIHSCRGRSPLNGPYLFLPVCKKAALLTSKQKNKWADPGEVLLFIRREFCVPTSSRGSLSLCSVPTRLGALR